MSFFDDLGDTLSSAGKIAAKKSREIADAAKIEAQIIAEQKVLDNLLKKLGQMCSDEIKALGNEVSDSSYISATDAMVSISRDVEASNGRLAELKQQKEDRKNTSE